MESSAIWTESYRPHSFDDVIGQKDIVSRIKALVETKNIPHLMFSGSPGVGKTTIALIIAKTLHGINWKHNFIELNGSDERGIQVIREKVKDFAKTMALDTNIPKVILLDEADALTKEAQQALRRTMETYSNSCRFILSANQASKIIDPIKSRCAIFKFKPLNKQDIIEIINKIAEKENLNIDNETINLLFENCGGDVRQLQNILQSSSAISKEINKESVSGFLISIESKDIELILNLALEKKFIEAKNKLLDTMLNNGLAGIDIIKQIQKEVMTLNISDNKKFNIIEKCGEIEFRLVEGSDDFVQLESLLAYLAKDN